MAPRCRWSLITSSSEATSMSDATSVLFGLEDEFMVLCAREMKPPSAIPNPALGEYVGENSTEPRSIHG